LCDHIRLAFGVVREHVRKTTNPESGQSAVPGSVVGNQHEQSNVVANFADPHSCRFVVGQANWFSTANDLLLSQEHFAFGFGCVRSDRIQRLLVDSVAKDEAVSFFDFERALTVWARYDNSISLCFRCFQVGDGRTSSFERDAEKRSHPLVDPRAELFGSPWSRKN
jgi:hypothetical protein